MKKVLSFVLAVLMMFSFAPFTLAADEIHVYVEGQKVIFDVPPQTINNRTMVPIRAIFEAMGATVEWNAETKTAVCVKDDTTVKMTLNSTTEYINDVPQKMDVAPVIINNRTLAPARYVAEAFGYYVNWDQVTRSVLISKDKNFDISQVRDGSREHPYKFGDKVTITFRKLTFSLDDDEYVPPLGKYEFTINGLLSPKEAEEKFDFGLFNPIEDQWVIDANVKLVDYAEENSCSYYSMANKSCVVSNEFSPGGSLTWYKTLPSYKTVELYKGGSSACYIPIRKDDIAEGESCDYFTIVVYSGVNGKEETIWFSLK